MIGLILYEAVDLVYHVGKLGYDGVYGAYRWYYNIPDEKTLREQEKENKIKMLENQIIRMENRQQILEKLLLTYDNNIVMIQDESHNNEVLMIEDIK